MSRRSLYRDWKGKQDPVGENELDYAAEQVISELNIMYLQQLILDGGMSKGSLNRDQRKKELLKITVENQQFLRRLQDKQSNYSVAKWEEDYKHKERIMKNMCEYPLVFDERNLLMSAAQTDYNSEGRLPRINTT